MRRATHESFNTRKAGYYQPLQEKEAALLVYHMLCQPEDWDNHFKRSAASMIFGIVYGWSSLDSSKDELARKVNDWMHRIVCAARPGAFLVDTFPWMLSLPDWMAKWKRDAKQWYRTDRVLFEGMLSDIAHKMVRTNEHHSVSWHSSA